MYDLTLKGEDRYLGQMTEADLQFLQDNLEEEGLTDDDYAISRLTLEYLRGNGLSEGLARLLDAALGEADEIEIVFKPHERS